MLLLCTSSLYFSRICDVMSSLFLKASFIKVVLDLILRLYCAVVNLQPGTCTGFETLFPVKPVFPPSPYLTSIPDTDPLPFILVVSSELFTWKQ